MILAQLRVEKHPKCWISEVSANYPRFQFLSMLVGLNRGISEVFLLIKPSDGVYDPEQEGRIVADIATVGVHQGLSIEKIGDHLFRVRVHDVGTAEEIVRVIIEREKYKETFFPPYQSLLAQAGKEYSYALFRSEADLDSILRQIRERVGKENIAFTVIDADVKKAEVKNMIPVWFDELLPPEISRLLKDAIDTPNPTTAVEKLTAALEAAQAYYWIIGLILAVLASYFGVNLSLP